MMRDNAGAEILGDSEDSEDTTMIMNSSSSQSTLDQTKCSKL